MNLKLRLWVNRIVTVSFLGLLFAPLGMAMKQGGAGKGFSESEGSREVKQHPSKVNRQPTSSENAPGSPMERLSDEIALNIFKQLPAETLGAVAPTSSQFGRLSGDRITNCSDIRFGAYLRKIRKPSYFAEKQGEILQGICELKKGKYFFNLEQRLKLLQEILRQDYMNVMNFSLLLEAISSIKIEEEPQAAVTTTKRRSKATSTNNEEEESPPSPRDEQKETDRSREKEKEKEDSPKATKEEPEEITNTGGALDQTSTINVELEQLRLYTYMLAQMNLGQLQEHAEVKAAIGTKDPTSTWCGVLELCNLERPLDEKSTCLIDLISNLSENGQFNFFYELASAGYLVNKFYKQLTDYMHTPENAINGGVLALPVFENYSGTDFSPSIGAYKRNDDLMTLGEVCKYYRGGSSEEAEVERGERFRKLAAAIAEEISNEEHRHYLYGVMKHNEYCPEEVKKELSEKPGEGK